MVCAFTRGQTKVSKLVADLKACSKLRDLQRGKEVHAHAIQTGNDSNIYVSSSLVDMYSKCKSMVDARWVFEEMPRHDVVSWTALMMGYAENGNGEEALELFTRMQSEGCTPNSRTFLAVVKACTGMAENEPATEVEGNFVRLKCLEKGLTVHSQAVRSGCDSNIFVASALIVMYAKCGSMADARGVFDRMQSHDVVSWTSLILGYADTGEGDLALQLLACMTPDVPDARTYVAALIACTSFAANEESKEMDGKLVKLKCLSTGLTIHLQLANSGYECNVYVASTLVDMYAKSGSMEHARRVFDRMPENGVVSWNALILGYAENGNSLVALQIFTQLLFEGCKPDAVTFVAALKACTNLATEEEAKEIVGKSVKINCLKKGVTIHSKAADVDCDLEISVANSMVNMYAICGSMLDSQKVFDFMPSHDVVSWNILLSGYAENGEGAMALEMYARMRREGCALNARTFVAALKACSSLAGNRVKLESIRKIHGEAVRFCCDSDVYVSSTLIDLYSNCGAMLQAQGVFDRMPYHIVISWNALILGYAENMEAELAFQLFSRMKCEGFAPDAWTFVAALKSCCVLATSAEGKKSSLRRGILIHAEAARNGYDSSKYVASSLIDMYAKCGRMVHAREVFDKMSCHGVVSWTALMQGYIENGECELALQLFGKMRLEGFTANARTLAVALKACAKADGKLAQYSLYVFYEAVKGGYDRDIQVQRAFVDVLGYLP